MSVKKRLIGISEKFEKNFDRLTFHLRKRLGTDAPLQVVPFRSYGTVNRVYVKGRVLKDKGVGKGTAEDTRWKNIVNMYKRFESDEVPGAELKVSFQGKDYFVTTDQEGYFTINLPATDVPLVRTDMWHEVAVELISAPYGSTEGIASSAEVLVPPEDAEFGIISDIDDTVVKTTATNLLAMARNTFFHNAHSRMPFAGVSEFYKALRSGTTGSNNNPFFYVSSSPWNLYDLLIDFLDINDIPEGPLLLRDFGLDAEKVNDGHMGHKFREVRNILTTYPDLKFVLIGDSGQEDPKIYREIVSTFPERILAIYIRDVTLPEREKVAIDIAKSLEEAKVEMVIVDNTIQAAEHAARAGLIVPEKIGKIVLDKKQDKGEIPGKESLDVLAPE